MKLINALFLICMNTYNSEKKIQHYSTYYRLYTRYRAVPHLLFLSGVLLPPPRERPLPLPATVLGEIPVPKRHTQPLNVPYSVRQNLHLGNPQFRVLSTRRDPLAESLKRLVHRAYSGSLPLVAFFHILG